MFRVIHESLRHQPLYAMPAPSRFSDPAGGYAVLYAAESVPCCFWEAVVRNRLTRSQRRELPRAEIDVRRVVSIESREDLSLVDLRGMDRSRSVLPPLLPTTQITPRVARCRRPLSPACRKPTDSCSSHGLRGTRALPYSTERSGNCVGSGLLR
ncbi:MAG: RES domain-containing protein [Acidobacteriia bacterium]|nr:RES domain-containing protein [Terriglobia bacterium]